MPEVWNLLEDGLDPNSSPGRSIGYRQTIDFLRVRNREERAGPIIYYVCLDMIGKFSVSGYLFLFIFDQFTFLKKDSFHSCFDREPQRGHIGVPNCGLFFVRKEKKIRNRRGETFHSFHLKIE